MPQLLPSEKIIFRCIIEIYCISWFVLTYFAVESNGMKLFAISKIGGYSSSRLFVLELDGIFCRGFGCSTASEFRSDFEYGLG